MRNGQSRRIAKGENQHRDVLEELRRSSVPLTDSQKKIAQYIIEKPQEVAFSTLDQLGAELQMNPSTIVRFAYRLRLDGFPDLQERMRQIVRGQLTPTANHGSSIADHLAESGFGASLSQDVRNLHRAISELSLVGLNRAVDILATAKNVYVVGSSLTLPLAKHCALALSYHHSGIMLVPEDELGTYPIADIGPDDCVLAFALPPDAGPIHRFLARAKNSNVQIVAVADAPLSETTTDIRDVVLHVPTTGAEALNSMVAPMAVVHALLAGLSAFNR